MCIPSLLSVIYSDQMGIRNTYFTQIKMRCFGQIWTPMEVFENATHNLTLVSQVWLIKTSNFSCLSLLQFLHPNPFCLTQNIVSLITKPKNWARCWALSWKSSERKVGLTSHIHDLKLKENKNNAYTCLSLSGCSWVSDTFIEKNSLKCFIQ